MRLKVGISYCGSYTRGWEGVGEFNFIKNLLQKAIFSFSKQKPHITCGAKTDAGVHAEINFCSFDLETAMLEHKIKHALNYHLPHYIRIISVENIKEFDARFSALSRHYKYLISCNTKRPILENLVWFVKLNNFYRIDEFAKLILAYSNFTSFCPSKTEGNKIRSLEQFYVIDKNMFGIHVREFNIIARSFIHHQVRNIIGALVDIEKGLLSMDLLCISLKTGSKIPINMAPAIGLYLHNINYQ